MSTKKPKIQKNQYMQVFVRCRPLNENESIQRNISAVDILNSKEIAVQDRCNSKIIKTFSFDKVFGPTASQDDVYQSVVQPLIADVLSAFNCTVFAYGQTGSGKTFTMEGDFGSDQIFSRDSKAGIIPRAMCALFDELRVLQAEYTVRISFIELYNEELYDLLSPDDVPPKLRLFDDVSKKGCVIVQGLQEVMVHTQSQVLDELRKGSAKRQVAATLMNAQSSRSHTVFSVTVHTKENSVHGEELLKTGKLNLVDLAGSENIGRSGSIDKRAREAASINQSLLTLSRVTACLVEHQPHVPYRESKLTRLLQDSLGGRTKTSLIATISPVHSNVDETLSTLDYALRAKSVANKPEVNQKVSQNVVMKEYMDVIEELQKKLDLHRNGSGMYVNDQNYRQMVEQIRERNKEINELISKTRALGAAKKNTEEIFASFTTSFKNHQLNLENVNYTIMKTSAKVKVASETLEKVKNEHDEAKNILETVSGKENELRNQAQQLTNVVESLHADSTKIHDRLDYSRVVLVENQVVLKRIREKGKFLFQSTKKMLSCLQLSAGILEKLLTAADKLNIKTNSTFDMLCTSIHVYLEKMKSSVDKIITFSALVLKMMKEGASDTASSILNVHLQAAKKMETLEKMLKDTCADYDCLISSLRNQSDSLAAFVNESFLNMKDVTEIQTNDMREKLNSILSASDLNIQTGLNLLNNLLPVRQVPHTKTMDDTMLMKKQANDINEICSKRLKEISAFKADLLSSKEETVKKTASIIEHSTASIGYIEQQQVDISDLCKTVEDAFHSSEEPLLSGLQERTPPIKETWSEIVGIIKSSEGKVRELLSHDHKTKIEKVLTESKNNRSERILTLNSVVAATKDIVEETNSCSISLSSKLADSNIINNEYEQNEDEALGIFLEGVQSTSSEVSEMLEIGKTSVTETVLTEMNYDVPTGQTPTRKLYGPIPQCATLPSPIVRKVKPRIQKASWKQLLRSPRKPLLSTGNLHDIDDDCMASDSEVTITKKGFEASHGLQKASSLSNLRSTAVFHRPRIPKKFGRKAL